LHIGLFFERERETKRKKERERERERVKEREGGESIHMFTRQGGKTPEDA